MSMEYEVKVQVEDLNDIEKKLIELGAQLLDEVEEEDYYVDLKPCIDLKSRDEALRIRISRSKVLKKEISEFTYKGPKIVPHAKIRKEITVMVDDGRKLIEIFTNLGFKVHTVKKRRKVYRYGPYKVFLDEVEKLGKFVEIEVEGVESVEQFIDAIRRIVALLKISENFVVKSYLEMLMERIEKIESEISKKE